MCQLAYAEFKTIMRGGVIKIIYILGYQHQ